MSPKCLLILFLICVGYVSRANGRLLVPVIETDDDYISEDSYDDDGFPTVRSSFAKTVTKFSCMADFDDAELLVYGTKAWRFPEQDINLTLTYPPKDHLSISLVSPKVNMMSYQFWLYGVPNTQTFHDKSGYILHDLC